MIYTLSFLTLHCYTYPLFHVLCKPLCTAGMLTVRHSMCARCCAFTLAQLGVTTAKSPHVSAPPAQPCPTTGYLSPLLSNSPFGNQSQVLPIFPHQTQNLWQTIPLIIWQELPQLFMFLKYLNFKTYLNTPRKDYSDVMEASRFVFSPTQPDPPFR